MLTQPAACRPGGHVSGVLTALWASAPDLGRGLAAPALRSASGRDVVSRRRLACGSRPCRCYQVCWLQGDGCAHTPEGAERRAQAGVRPVGRGVLWAAGRLLRGTGETHFWRGLWVSGRPLPGTTQSDVSAGTRALLWGRSLRAGTEERFVIKVLVFEHILSSLLGRPPTFLAEEVLGSAEFCCEFLAFVIHVKINVLSRCDLVGLSGPSPGPAGAAAACGLSLLSPRAAVLGAALPLGVLRALYHFSSCVASSLDSWV